MLPGGPVNGIRRSRGARIQHWLERGGTAAWRRCLSGLTTIGARWRRHQLTFDVPEIPTIVVGSLAMGGVGKTQVVAYLASHLGDDYRIGIVSRGYPNTHPHPVEVLGHGEGTFGDEAEMLKAQLGESARIWVATNLEQGRRQAQVECDVVVVDGGLQNTELRRSFTVVVVDPGMARGVVPAGPLREPWQAIARADLLWCHGEPPSNELETAWRGRLVHSRPALQGCFAADGEAHPPEWLEGRRIQTLCGIARPERFYKLLTNAGAVIKGGYEVRDHGEFSEEILLDMVSEADPICTTEKDVSRVPCWVPAFTVRIGLELRSTAPLALIDEVLGAG